MEEESSSSELLSISQLVQRAEAPLARAHCLEVSGRGAHGTCGVRDHKEPKSSHSFMSEVLGRLSASFHS